VKKNRQHVLQQGIATRIRPASKQERHEEEAEGARSRTNT
jgi:hypothetical protein